MVCLSTANVIFVHSWAEMFPGTDQQYYSNIIPTPVALISLIITSFFVATFFYLCRLKTKNTNILFALEYTVGAIVALVALDAFRKYAMPTIGINMQYIQYFLGSKLFLLALLFLIVLIITYSIYRPQISRALFRNAMITLLPFPILFCFKIVPAIELTDKQSKNKFTEHKQQHRATKLIVIIFDEWDKEFTFEKRPIHIKLPEIDRFTTEYTNFTHALPSAADTSRSIPGMLIGEEFQQIRTKPHGDMWLKRPNEYQERLWSSTTDIFSDIDSAGWKTHFIQWHHVYGPNYTNSRPNLTISHYVRDPIWVGAEKSYKEWASALRRPWTNFFNTVWALERIITHKNNPHHENLITSMEDELIKTITDNNHDAIWAHLAWPHGPAVIDASNGEPLRRRNPTISNLDNMLLVDRTIQRVRKTMEDNDTWDSAMVILTSDHWQRDSNVPHPPQDKTQRIEGLRIPLLIKCPKQRTPRQIETWTSITSLREWIRSLTKGQNINPDTLEKNIKQPRNDIFKLLKSPNKAE